MGSLVCMLEFADLSAVVVGAGGLAVMLDPVWLAVVDVGGSGLLEMVIGLEGLTGMVDLPRLLAVLDVDLGRSAVVTNLDGSKVVVVVGGFAGKICVWEDFSALVVGVSRFSEEVNPERLYVGVGGLVVLVGPGGVEVVVDVEELAVMVHPGVLELVTAIGMGGFECGSVAVIGADVVVLALVLGRFIQICSGDEFRCIRSGGIFRRVCSGRF